MITRNLRDTHLKTRNKVPKIDKKLIIKSKLILNRNYEVPNINIDKLEKYYEENNNG